MAPTTRVFPASLLLAGRRCLVVGGRTVAHRKISALLEAGAVVTVVAPEVIDEVAALPVGCERRPYRRGEVAGYWLAVAATGDPEVDSQVFADGEAAHVFVNAADDPPFCSFHFPAVLRRGEVSVAVATNGTAPGLASWLRERLAEAAGPEIERLALVAGDVRRRLRAARRATEGRDWHGLMDALHSTLLEELAGAASRQATDTALAELVDAFLAPDQAEAVPAGDSRQGTEGPDE